MVWLIMHVLKNMYAYKYGDNHESCLISFILRKFLFGDHYNELLYVSKSIIWIFFQYHKFKCHNFVYFQKLTMACCPHLHCPRFPRQQLSTIVPLLDVTLFPYQPMGMVTSTTMMAPLTPPWRVFRRPHRQRLLPDHAWQPPRHRQIQMSMIKKRRRKEVFIQVQKN